jgi:hypothetical protein
MPTSAYEYGTPGVPLLFGAQKDQLLSTLFARKDYLLGRTLHVCTSFASLGRYVDGYGEPSGCMEGNFTYSRHGYKMNRGLL